MLLSLFLKNKLGFIASIIAIILFFLLYFNINAKNKEIIQLKIANANFKALNDSIRVSAAKSGAVEFNKYAYLAQENSDLKKTNSDLYNQIKNTKGDVKTAISSSTKISDSGKLIVKVIHDTIDNTVKGAELTFDTTYSKGNYHHLKATVHVEGLPDSLQFVATLDKDEIGFTALTGIKKDKDGNYEIFVQPGYPGAKITQLDGAFIDKSLFQKPDRRRLLTFGIGFGYIPFTYDWRTKSIELGTTKFGITIGISANISELLRRK